MAFDIGFLVFPRVQQLDLTAPYEVLATLTESRTHLIWKTLAPVTSSTGLVLMPNTTLATCPPLDLLCIPGGAGCSPISARSRPREGSSVTAT